MFSDHKPYTLESHYSVSSQTAPVQRSQGGSQRCHRRRHWPSSPLCHHQLIVGGGRSSFSVLPFLALPGLTAYDPGFAMDTKVARKYSSTFCCTAPFPRQTRCQRSNSIPAQPSVSSRAGRSHSLNWYTFGSQNWEGKCPRGTKQVVQLLIQS